MKPIAQKIAEVNALIAKGVELDREKALAFCRAYVSLHGLARALNQAKGPALNYCLSKLQENQDSLSTVTSELETCLKNNRWAFLSYFVKFRNHPFFVDFLPNLTEISDEHLLSRNLELIITNKDKSETINTTSLSTLLFASPEKASAWFFSKKLEDRNSFLTRLAEKDCCAYLTLLVRFAPYVPGEQNATFLSRLNNELFDKVKKLPGQESVFILLSRLFVTHVDYITNACERLDTLGRKLIEALDHALTGLKKVYTPVLVNSAARYVTSYLSALAEGPLTVSPPECGLLINCLTISGVFKQLGQQKSVRKFLNQMNFVSWQDVVPQLKTVAHPWLTPNATSLENNAIRNVVAALMSTTEKKDNVQQTVLDSNPQHSVNNQNMFLGLIAVVSVPHNKPKWWRLILNRFFPQFRAPEFTLEQKQQLICIAPKESAEALLARDYPNMTADEFINFINNPLLCAANREVLFNILFQPSQAVLRNEVYRQLGKNFPRTIVEWLEPLAGKSSKSSPVMESFLIQAFNDQPFAEACRDLSLCDLIYLREHCAPYALPSKGMLDDLYEKKIGSVRPFDLKTLKEHYPKQAAIIDKNPLVILTMYWQAEKEGKGAEFLAMLYGTFIPPKSPDLSSTSVDTTSDASTSASSAPSPDKTASDLTSSSSPSLSSNQTPSEVATPSHSVTLSGSVLHDTQTKFFEKSHKKSKKKKKSSALTLPIIASSEIVPSPQTQAMLEINQLCEKILAAKLAVENSTRTILDVVKNAMEQDSSKNINEMGNLFLTNAFDHLKAVRSIASLYQDWEKVQLEPEEARRLLPNLKLLAHQAVDCVTAVQEILSEAKKLLARVKVQSDTSSPIHTHTPTLF